MTTATMTPTLTPEEVELVRVMEEIVAEKGDDYVYPADDKIEDVCQYVKDLTQSTARPSCIAGHYFHRTGWDLWELNAVEGSTVEGAYRQRESLDKHHTVPRWVAALQAAQKRQDGGSTWGAALAELKRHLGIDPEAGA